MAPPAFSAQQLPRHAQPKTNAQKRAAASAAAAGRRGGAEEGAAGGKSSVAAEEAGAAAKAKAKREMEAMRLRVVEQYKELKLKQHAEKEHGPGSARR